MAVNIIKNEKTRQNVPPDKSTHDYLWNILL